MGGQVGGRAGGRAGGHAGARAGGRAGGRAVGRAAKRERLGRQDRTKILEKAITESQRHRDSILLVLYSPKSRKLKLVEMLVFLSFSCLSLSSNGFSFKHEKKHDVVLCFTFCKVLSHRASAQRSSNDFEPRLK